jgi:cyclophilin family peptidyl-prolyl cis-trans isomerase
MISGPDCIRQQDEFGLQRGGKQLQWNSPPAMAIDQKKTYTAIIKTNHGDITVQLLPQDAPLAVNNFVFLARQGFYDSVIFHRIIKGFMMQGGDPTGTGRGGPGYKFADEPVKRKYTAGTVAMANAGPNTNGSQFFIMFNDYPLPPNYTIFGQVSAGMDVVKKISEVPVTVGGDGAPSKPTADVRIDSVSIVEE